MNKIVVLNSFCSMLLDRYLHFMGWNIIRIWIILLNRKDCLTILLGWDTWTVKICFQLT